MATTIPNEGWISWQVPGTKGRSAWVNESVLATTKSTDGNRTIVVDLRTQTLTAFWNQNRIFEMPVTTGKPGHATPTGIFEIIEKQRLNRSNIYGSIVNDNGEIIISGVDKRSVKMPKNSKWKGAPMPFWMRLNWSGIGMHTGKLGNTPLSHGCIRLPKKAAEDLFYFCKVGDQVIVR